MKYAETAERAKSLRARTGLSQFDFSVKYDVPIGSVRNWEQGLNAPPAYVLKLLERVIAEDFPE